MRRLNSLPNLSPSPRIQKVITAGFEDLRRRFEEALEPQQKDHAALLQAVQAFRRAVAVLIHLEVDPQHPLLQIGNDAEFLRKVAESRSEKIRQFVGEKVRAVLEMFAEVNQEVGPLQAGLEELEITVQRILAGTHLSVGQAVSDKLAGAAGFTAVREGGSDARKSFEKIRNTVLIHLKQTGETRLKNSAEFIASTGFSRETVSRYLHTLAEEGLFTIEGTYRGMRYVLTKRGIQAVRDFQSDRASRPEKAATARDNRETPRAARSRPTAAEFADKVRDKVRAALFQVLIESDRETFVNSKSFMQEIGYNEKAIYAALIRLADEDKLLEIKDRGKRSQLFILTDAGRDALAQFRQTAQKKAA